MTARRTRLFGSSATRFRAPEDRTVRLAAHPRPARPRCRPSAPTTRAPSSAALPDRARMSRSLIERPILGRSYYPCLEATVGRPYALYVHGNSDTTGAGPRRRGHRHRPEMETSTRAAHRDWRGGRRRARGLLGVRRHGRRQSDGRLSTAPVAVVVWIESWRAVLSRQMRIIVIVRPLGLVAVSEPSLVATRLRSAGRWSKITRWPAERPRRSR